MNVKSILLFLLLLGVFSLQGAAAPRFAVTLQLGEGSPVHVWMQGVQGEVELSNPDSRQTVSGNVYLSFRDAENREIWKFRERVELAPGQNLSLPLPEPERFGPCTLSGTLPGANGEPEPFLCRFAHVCRPATDSHSSMQYGIVLLTLPMRLVKPGALACRLAGADFIRSGLNWKEIETAPGQWDWDYYDAYFGELKSRRLRWAPILWYASPWGLDAAHRSTLKPESGPCRFPCPEPRKWKDFVTRVLKHYGQELQTVEVWNEPELPFFADFTPEEYAGLLKIVRTVIQKHRLPIRITTCGFVGLPGQHPKMIYPDYMPRVLRAAKGAYDYHAIHLHGGFDRYRESIDRFLQLRKEWQVSVPWAANETAISSAHCSRQEQAAVLFEKLVYSQAKGAVAYVWHNLRDLGCDPKNAEHNYGLFDNGLEPKEAFSAYSGAVHLFRGAEIVRDLSCGERICLIFRKGDELLIPAWTIHRADRSRILEFSSIRGEAFLADLYGNRKALTVRNGKLRFPVSCVPGTLILKQRGLPVLSGESLLVSTDAPVRIPATDQLSGPPCFTLDKTETCQNTAPADPSFADCVWRGAGDCSARIWMASVQNQTLILKLEVRDDVFVPGGPLTSGRGDGVRLFFGNGSGRSVEFSLSLNRQGKAQLYCLDPETGKNRNALLKKCRYSVTRDTRTKKTDYLLRLPIAELGLKSGVPFRFNAAVYDDDGKVRESYHALAPLQAPEYVWPQVVFYGGTGK